MRVPRKGDFCGISLWRLSTASRLGIYFHSRLVAENQINLDRVRACFDHAYLIYDSMEWRSLEFLIRFHSSLIAYRFIFERILLV